MGNIFSVSLSCDELVPLVLSFLCGKAEYLHTLEENLEALQKKKQDLNAMRNDLLKRVSKEESRGLQALPEVKEWFTSVEEIEAVANCLLDDSIFQVHRLAMYGYCSQISASTHRYIEKVLMTLKEVETLRSKGVFEVVVDRPLPPLVKKMLPIQLTVSQEKLFERTWNTLKDENVGTLCLYGMGGIGKTTLLNQIKSKVREAGDAFDLVMFVVVGSEEVESIQGEIINVIDISNNIRRFATKVYMASEIYRVLNRQRFVLLLDDLPKKVDLEKIGVPLPSKRNGCKIVFTTRSREPCGSNWVDAEVEVTCLSSEEACDLFQKTLEETTLKNHRDIPKLTRIVARKCHGLPLVLSVISKTMACKKMVREWHHAIHVLVSSSGTEDEILPILKLSYDSLPGEYVRLCFLYCALFPKGYQTSKQDLVDCWIGEGIIKAEDRGIAEIKSYGMIGELVRMGLLTEDESRDGVKMHDMVREMALWIASDFGRKKEHFVVIEGEGVHKMPEVNDWRMVTRMSVTSTQIESILDSPECTELTTLSLKGNSNLKRISGDFFQWMTSLVLLDMSHNRELSELPEEVSCLVSLQFLNLSWTLIKRLPHGLKLLKSLIHLDLDHTYDLQGIDVIASLLNLQVLRLFWSVPMDLSLMDDIQLLKNLKELSLTVAEDAVVLQRLLSIHPLASCIRRLHLTDITITNGGILSLKAMSSLRELNIVSCDIQEMTVDLRSTIQEETVHFRNIEKIPQFSNIRRVSLFSCKGLRDLTWVLFAPSLGDLSLYNCPQIERIISEEKAMPQLGHRSEQPFQNLTRLTLFGLPELESIYWTPLPFPVLEYLEISDCPKLRRLPFNSQSAIGNQVEMELDKQLIEVVEWEDEATKQRFSNFYDRFLPRYDLASIQNIVVVGTKGSGKSATANSIAGKTVFNPLAHTSDGSTRCHNRYSLSELINVIDTPGLFDLSASPEFISKEMVRCLTLAEGGIHALLLVFSAGKQISEEEEEHIVSTLQVLFGSKIFDYLIVVFTGGDKLENDQVTLEEFLIVDCPDFLKRVLKMCGHRMILFDNKTKDEAKKKQQLDSLLSLVRQIENYNSGKPYTNEMYHMIKEETDKLEINQKELQLKGLSEEQIVMSKKALQKSYHQKLKAMFDPMKKLLRLSEESKSDEKVSLQMKTTGLMKWSLEDSQQESADPTVGVTKSMNFFQNIIKPFKRSSNRGLEDYIERIAALEQNVFPFQVLVSATKDFHPTHKLGEGGFGPVFKGRLPNGRDIAVKKLSHASRQGKNEFVNEAKLLAKVQHRNVVNLWGYCTHGDDKLLVYEYVANESLDKVLFKSNRKSEIDWKQRFEIITGIARGLLYLHEDAPNCSIHRDIKAGNILLDEKWIPKIADFGMARLFQEDQTHVNTYVAGTNGYMAPEYVMHGVVSVKADVFSFGVLVLELVSGQKNSSFSMRHPDLTLLEWAYKLYKKGRTMEILDPEITASADSDQVKLCVQIGLLCVQGDPHQRPPMRRVSLLLSRKPGNLEEPERPGVPGSRYRRRTHRASGTSSLGTVSTTGSSTGSFGSNLNTGTGGRGTPASSRTPTRTHATRSAGPSSSSSDPHGKRPMSY